MRPAQLDDRPPTPALPWWAAWSLILRTAARSSPSFRLTPHRAAVPSPDGGSRHGDLGDQPQSAQGPQRKKAAAKATGTELHGSARPYIFLLDASLPL